MKATQDSRCRQHEDRVARVFHASSLGGFTRSTN